MNTQEASSEDGVPLYQQRGWLQQQYVIYGKTMAEIAEECGVSHSTIQRWVSKYGIETRTNHDYRRGVGSKTSYKDPGWLKEQYWVEEKSLREIADECGVTVESVRLMMVKNGIPRRTSSEANRLAGRPDEDYEDEEWLREQYHDYGKSTVEIADDCGVDNTTIGYWMGKHGIPRRSEEKQGLVQYDKTVVFRKGVEDIKSEPDGPIRISKDNVVFEGSEFGLDLTTRSIGDRNVTEVLSPWRDGTWLRSQHHDENKSVNEIAEVCDVSPQTIRNWMEKHGIRRRRHMDAIEQAVDPKVGDWGTVDKSYREENWLKVQYWEKEKSLADIAEECGISASTVRYWMDKYSIPRRGAAETNHMGES